MLKNILYATLAFILFTNTAYTEVTTESTTPVAVTTETTALEKEILQAVNKERQQKNVPDLKFNDKLMTIAREHSVNMATAGKPAHDLNGSSFQSRISKVGYEFNKIGENIAMVGRTKNSAEEDAKEVVKNWMNSPIHRDNILMSDFTEVGIGHATAPNGYIYYTMAFGKPK